MTKTNQRRPRPKLVVWELYDPLDDTLLLRSEAPYGETQEERARHSRIIRAAPAKFRPLGRPDGKPIGVRKLKTRTHLIY